MENDNIPPLGFTHAVGHFIDDHKFSRLKCGYHADIFDTHAGNKKINQEIQNQRQGQGL
jgi:hypothetical protein